MKLRIILFLLLTTSLSAFADYNKNSLFEDLVKKYWHLKSISASFNDVARGITGVIKASQGNKYSIKTGTRSIVSDGITVWNYDATSKKVVINAVDPGNMSASIDKIFFNFVDNYTPSDITKNEYGYTLELVKKNSKNQNQDKLMLWVDGKTLDIFKIQLNNETSVNTWEVVDLRLNRKFKTNTFIFSVPKGTEVIDLR